MKRVGMVVGVVLVVMLLLLYGPDAQAEGVWYVTLEGDDTFDCLSPTTACATINAVLDKATFRAGDTILVELGQYTDQGSNETFVLLDKNVTISGGWNSDFSEQTSFSIMSGNAHTGFTISEGVRAVLELISVKGGFDSYSNRGAGQQPAEPVREAMNSRDPLSWHRGSYGAIENLGTLTLINSGGGSFNGYGIYNRGTLSMSDSGAGGAIGIVNAGTLTMQRSSASYGFGGSCTGIANYGTLTMTFSVIMRNTARGGYGGGLCNFGQATLRDSTVVSNFTYHSGFQLHGGGIYNSGTLELTNVTLSGNSADDDGGGIYNRGSLYLNNTSITYNSSSRGGGLFNTQQGSVIMQNSLLAYNENLEALGADCQGTVQSQGYNLIGKPSGCEVVLSEGDLIDTDPLLSRYLRPIEGGIIGTGYQPFARFSVAVDAGNPAGCTDHKGHPLQSDQRGVARYGRCDIGAYESHPDHDPFSYSWLPFIIK